MTRMQPATQMLIEPVVPHVGDRPLVTYAIYAANEERHIGEAIRSALEQTYTPLEIVLSDDCSSDRTYEIMQEMTAAYAGPHRVILNQNPKKLGIGNQINRIVALSEGEMIVLANGDDIALPRRTDELVRVWLESGKRWDVLCSDMSLIDVEDRVRAGIWDATLPDGDLEARVLKRLSGAAAASMAVSRRLFEQFGPLHPNLIIEDNPLALRALLRGGYLHLTDKLVRYRVHDGNCCRMKESASVEEFKRQVLWYHRESFRAYLQMLNDLYASPVTVKDPGELARARKAAVGKLVESAILRDFYAEPDERILTQYWKILFRLMKILLKLTIKSKLPFIERRNARWHIQNRQRAGL